MSVSIESPYHVWHIKLCLLGKAVQSTIAHGSVKSSHLQKIREHMLNGFGAQSWMHAFLKALDRATMVGRTAVQEKAYFHDSVLSYLWGPFGWWRRQLRLQHLHTSP